eukprot:CAMPEP_0185019448 /NCGR_PEP_ID=MMETSP1103-20130426/2063_1 /TAXON_ID=36769 /ORGANISM="Paraphysomonas bandaiensis, Strain Caron Lab Isolate" /LENGTH=468 /DNA_ID=CAMNT_0027549771 /DNA_START=1 /DNA_END=1407 /DNA_ORIENTATION=+
MDIAKKNDLTFKMAPFLDVHMISSVLDFLREIELYDSKVIAKEKIRVLMKTNMLELVQDEINTIPADDKSIHGDPNLSKEHLEDSTNKIFDKIDNETDAVKLCTEFFSDMELVESLKAGSNLTIEYVSAHHGITQQVLEEYYKFSKFKYDCGMYCDAEEMLGNFLSVAQAQTTSVLGALWGRLACRILQAKWDESLTDINAVKDAIESRSIAPMDQLRQRAWLMHWGLLVFLNQRDGFDALYHFFSEKIYLQTIENVCPWLLRYYTCAAILSSHRRAVMMDVLNEILATSYLHSDPMTQFVESVYERFDFEEAQQRLSECLILMKNDFFLQIYADKFLHEARLLLCEVYCAINRRVNMVTLAEKLQLSEDEAERWMVEMVRGAVQSNAQEGSTTDSSSAAVTTLNARIDSSGKQVLMAPPPKMVHQKVADRTRDLTVRAGILNSNLENLMNEQGEYIMRQQQMRSQSA